MVSVEVKGLPPAVKVAGLKLQFESKGRPLQARFTAPVNPLLGVMVRVKVALCPGRMDALAGFAVMVKSPIDCKTAGETLAEKLGLPE